MLKEYLYKLKSTLLLNNKEILNSKYSEELHKLSRLDNIDFELINQFKQFDIAYIRMNEKDIKKLRYKKGHTNRPFLIVKQNEEDLSFTGFYLSGDLNYSKYQHDQNHKCIIRTPNLSKNSIVNFKEPIKIPYEQVLDYKDTLSEKEIKKIKKYYEIWKYNYTETDLVEVGDLIKKDDKTYFIYQEDNQNIYGVNTNKESSKKIKKIDFDTQPTYVLIGNNELYKFNYQETINIKKNIQLPVTDTYLVDDIEKVKSKKADYNYLRKHPKK